MFLCAALVAGLGLAATLVVLGVPRALRANLDRMGADLLVFPSHRQPKSRERPSDEHRRNCGCPGRTSIASPRSRASPLLPRSSTWQLCATALSAKPELFLMAYDPATDFVVEPWLEQEMNGGLGLGGSRRCLHLGRRWRANRQRLRL